MESEMHASNQYPLETERRFVSRVVEQTIEVALEIARERRGIGALFVVGEPQNILAHSRCMILDPLLGHPVHLKNIADPCFRGTLKELACLKGAFIVSEDGVVVSAARCVNFGAGSTFLPDDSSQADLSISRCPGAVGVIVSKDSQVRVFSDDEVFTEIRPG